MFEARILVPKIVPRLLPQWLGTPRPGTRQTIAPLALTTSSSTLNQNSYETASIAPSPNSLVLLWVEQTGTTASGPAAITGNGLTWELVASTAASGVGIFLYRAMAPVPTAGTVVIDFAGGDVTTGCMWSIVQYEGVEQGSNGANAIRQFVASAAAAALTANITLAAFGHVSNVHAYGITHGANEVTAPGVGYSETGDTQHATPNRALETAYMVNDLVADPSWATSSASRWVGVELKAGLA